MAHLPDDRGFGELFPRFEDNRNLTVRRTEKDAPFEASPEEEQFGDPSAAEYLGAAVRPARLHIMLLAVLAPLLAVVVRTGQLQLSQGGDLSRKAESNRLRTERVPVERGIIYDSAGRPLVSNVPSFSATVVPADLPRDPQMRRETLARVASLLGQKPMDIEKAIAEYGVNRQDPVVIADDIPHDEAVLVSVEASRTPALGLDIGTRREYPLADSVPSLAHVLGYESRVTQADLDRAADSQYAPTDLIGKMGLERFYESALRGSPGERRVEVDAVGRRKRTVSENRGTKGTSLVLALDLDLQREAEAALRDELKLTHKSRGSVVVLDPRTGEVRALVSWPSFSNELFAQGIGASAYSELISDKDKPLFMRAIAGSLPAGSTFKPVIGAAALEEKIVTPSTTFMSTGGLKVGQWFFPDWKAGGHGPTDLAKAIAESVNTYFYTVGGGYDRQPGLGPWRIASYAARFGFGMPLGIDLPGEQGGFLPTPEWKEQTRHEVWYIGDTYHVAIGQGDVLVTPLQIAAMTTVFANGGTLYEPHLVSVDIAADGSRQEIHPTVLRSQVVSAPSIEAVRRGMRQTVTAGSARSLGDLPVAVAAKTGTAQWSSDKSTHAWFTSFAPYDKPQLTVTVLVEEGGEGSSVAAPIAKRIYGWYFRDKSKPYVPYRPTVPVPTQITATVDRLVE